MQVDKQQIVEMFVRRGDLTRAEEADETLPERVDPIEHADLLAALGLNAGLLATQADNLES